VSPLGVGAGALIDSWMEGRSGIEDGAGRCDAFDPADHLSRKELRRADRFTQMALAAAGEALEEAGFTNGDPPVPGERTACVIGTGIGASRRSRTSTWCSSTAGPPRSRRWPSRC